MATVVNSKLKKWLHKAISDLNATGYAQDIHIDLLFDDSLSILNNHELFERCCSTFKNLVEIITEDRVNLDNAEIYLNVDLVSESNKFSGVPKTKDDLVKSMDRYSVPEIILYKDTGKIPFNEFYRAPMLYDDFHGMNNIIVLYKEYRLENDLANSDYIKDVNIIYNKWTSNVSSDW